MRSQSNGVVHNGGSSFIAAAQRTVTSVQAKGNFGAGIEPGYPFSNNPCELYLLADSLTVKLRSDKAATDGSSPSRPTIAEIAQRQSFRLLSDRSMVRSHLSAPKVVQGRYAKRARFLCKEFAAGLIPASSTKFSRS